MIKTCYGGNFNIQEIEEVLDLLAHVRNNYTPEQVAEDMYISFYKITMRYFNKKKPKTSLFHYTEKQFIYYLRDWLWKVYYEKRNTDLNVAYNDNTDYRLNPLLPIDVYDRMLRVLLLVPKPPILAILLYRKALGDGYEEITKDVGVGSRRDMFKWNPLVNSQRKQVQQYLSLQENNEVSTFSVRPFKAVTTSRKERAKTTRNT